MRSIAALSIVFLLTGPLGVSAQNRASPVSVQEVAMRELTEVVPVFADVATARDGSVASRVAGNVEKVHVLAGAKVAQGDILIELNRELLDILVSQSRAELAEADASITTARARLQRAETVFERTQALRGSSAFSQGRFDDAQADVLEARSQLAEAQARLETSQARLAESTYRLARSRITAPFSGVVVSVDAIPGAYIQAGTPVLRLLDTESFEIEAAVPSRYVGGLRPGLSIDAITADGTGFKAELRAILPLEDAATRTRPVRLAAPALGQMDNIALGEALTVQIPIGAPREVLSVPKDALVQSQGGWIVYVAVDGKAQPRPVSIGVALGDRYEVVSGLAPGDMAVVRGNERLRPGQDILPTVVEGF
ncbi:MAG: efflux RND transporter periplasmic adaptor subunit [Sulfitobacter sp.]